MTPFTFLILIMFFLVSLAKDFLILVIFSKNQLFVLLISSINFYSLFHFFPPHHNHDYFLSSPLFGFSFVFEPYFIFPPIIIMIISFLSSLWIQFALWVQFPKVECQIIDFRFFLFFDISVCSYKSSFKHCFCYIPSILECCVFVFTSQYF